MCSDYTTEDFERDIDELGMNHHTDEAVDRQVEAKGRIIAAYHALQSQLATYEGAGDHGISPLEIATHTVTIRNANTTKAELRELAELFVTTTIEYQKRAWAAEQENERLRATLRRISRLATLELMYEPGDREAADEAVK